MSPIKTTLKKVTPKPSMRRINSSTFGRLKPGISSDRDKKSTGFLDRIICASIALAFFLPPIFFTGLLAAGSGFEKMMLFSLITLVGVTAWIAKSYTSKEFHLKRTPLDIPIIIFLVIAVISTSTSVGLKDSLLGTYGSSSKSLYAILIFTLFYYFVINNLEKEKVKKAFYSLIASTTIVLVYSLFQIFGVFLLPIDVTQVNTFNLVGSLSGLSAFSAIVLPVLLTLFIKAELIVSSKKALLPKQIFLGILILIDILILAILSGFTSWVVVIVTIGILLALAYSKVIKVHKGSIVTLSIVLVIALGLYLPSIIKKDGKRIVNFDIATLVGVKNLPAEVSLTKGAAWDIAKKSMSESMFLGSGPSTFYYNFNKHKGTGFNNTNLWNIKFDSSSGIFYELLSTMGILGVLPLITLIIITILSSYKAIRKSGDSEEQVYLLAVFMGFVSVIGISFLYGFNAMLNIFSILISVLVIAIMGIYSPGDKKEIVLKSDAQKKFSFGLTGVSVGTGLVVVALFLVGVSGVIADCYASKSVKETAAQDKINKLKKATKFAPFQDAYHVALSNHYVALANQTAVNGDANAANEALISSIESGKAAIMISPSKSDNYESLALLYENAYYYTKDALEWSERYYANVITLEPDSPTPYLRLGLINMARARQETLPEEQGHYVGQAIAFYDEAIKKKVNLASAHYGKSVAFEAIGDIDNAIQSLTNATIIDQNSNFVFELGRLYFNKGVSLSTLGQGDQVKDNLVIDGENNEEKLSVKPGSPNLGQISDNTSLKTAEQLFLSILLQNQNHVNSRYSLALLYQKTGNTRDAKIMVTSLLKLLTDEEQKNTVKKQFQGLY